MPQSRGLRIVIPGGTGQLGTILARHFYEQGHSVATISRYPKAQPWEAVHWDAHSPGPWMSVIDGADAVINLAGRSTHCRQTGPNRAELLQSRVRTTELIGQAIAQAIQPPPVWMNASLTSIYAQSFDADVSESGKIDPQEASIPEKWNFTVSLALEWERAQAAAATPRTRQIALRTPPVMTPSGGMFDCLLRLVRWGFGGDIGTGDQYVSWIHDFDFIRAVEFLIEHDNVAGPVNLCAPCPIPNHQFMCNLRRCWCTSYFGVPAPEWVAESVAFLVRTEPEIFLKSCRAVPKRLLSAGFDFHFPQWRGACENLVGRWRSLQAPD